MPAAATLLSATSHPGLIVGPGVPTVLIGGLPAAVVGDAHICAFPPPAVHPPNIIVAGSAKVLIGGRFAARVGDPCACGAQIESGVVTVEIN
jgi:uncharacterized Zn-binding protein involved in type VI secretion